MDPGSTPNACGGHFCVVVGGSVNSNMFDWTITRGGDESNASSQSARIENIICKAPGGTIAAGTIGWTQTISKNSTASGSLQVCAPGSTIAMLTFRVLYDRSNVFVFTGGYPNSEHVNTTTVQCRRPDGSEFTITADDVGHPDRIAFPSCDAASEGSMPMGATVTGGPSWNPTRPPVISVTTNPDMFEQYPDCFDALNGLKCQLRVYVMGDPCRVGDLGCTNWQEYAQDYPSRVQCRFGSYVVSLMNCEALKRAYQSTNPVTGVDPDGSPNPNPNPNPSNPPNPTPTPTPTPTPNPPPTSGPNPVGPGVVITPETDPDASQGCLGAEWSWNPVSWVYAPVKCAFKWAFIPETSLSTRVGSITSQIGTKFPFALVGLVASIPSAIPGGSCPDWRIKVGPLDQNIVCSSSYVGAIRNARPVLAAFMIVLAFWPMARSIAYASFPIIKPVPTGGR